MTAAVSVPDRRGRVLGAALRYRVITLTLLVGVV